MLAHISKTALAAMLLFGNGNGFATENWLPTVVFRPGSSLPQLVFPEHIRHDVSINADEDAFKSALSFEERIDKVIFMTQDERALCRGQYRPTVLQTSKDIIEDYYLPSLAGVILYFLDNDNKDNTNAYCQQLQEGLEETRARCRQLQEDPNGTWMHYQQLQNELDLLTEHQTLSDEEADRLVEVFDEIEYIEASDEVSLIKRLIDSIEYAEAAQIFLTLCDMFQGYMDGQKTYQEIVTNVLELFEVPLEDNTI